MRLLAVVYATDGGDEPGSRIMTNKHIGSSFDSVLDEEGLREDVTEYAVKRVLAWQIEQAMQEQDLSRNAMAKRMHTGRTQLDRLLDLDNEEVQLDTVKRAAAAVGRRLRLALS